MEKSILIIYLSLCLMIIILPTLNIIMRKYSASTSISLPSYCIGMCEKNAVALNPTQGVQRLTEETYEGKTPALSNDQARRLLDAPPEHTLKGKRDRAILATLLYHGLRRQELCDLRVGDIQERSGVKCLYVRGKGGKVRYVPLHQEAAVRLAIYMEANDLNDVAFCNDPTPSCRAERSAAE